MPKSRAADTYVWSGYPSHHDDGHHHQLDLEQAEGMDAHGPAEWALIGPCRWCGLEGLFSPTVAQIDAEIRWADPVTGHG